MSSAQDYIHHQIETMEERIKGAGAFLMGKRSGIADILVVSCLDRARLDGEAVPCAPVLSRYEVIEDAQVRENKRIEEHDDATLGKVRQPRPAARFDATPAAIRSLATYLGADNAAILSELS